LGTPRPKRQAEVSNARAESKREGDGEKGWAGLPEFSGQYAGGAREEKMTPRIRIRPRKTGAAKVQKPRLPKMGKPNLRKMKGLPRM
jgi:hypothetical protein